MIEALDTGLINQLSTSRFDADALGRDSAFVDVSELRTDKMPADSAEGVSFVCTAVLKWTVKLVMSPPPYWRGCSPMMSIKQYLAPASSQSSSSAIFG